MHTFLVMSLLRYAAAATSCPVDVRVLNPQVDDYDEFIQSRMRGETGNGQNDPSNTSDCSSYLQMKVQSPWEDGSAAFPGRNGAGYPIPDMLCCQGNVQCSGSGCVLRDTMVNHSKLKSMEEFGSNLWNHLPTIPKEVLSVHCAAAVDSLGSVCPLASLQRAHHTQYHLIPLLNATSAFSAAEQFSYHKTIAKKIMLVARDGSHSPWHQIGSVVAAAELVMTSAIPREDLEVMFIDKHGSMYSDELWSPGLASVARDASGSIEGLRIYEQVLLPMSAQAHWWWGNYQPSDSPALIGKIRHRILHGFNLTSVQPGNVITLVNREASEGRTLIDPDGVVTALQRALPENEVNAVSFSAIPLRSQMEQIVRSKLLISTHGAALTWGLFLPQKAALLEIDGSGQEDTRFFENLCAWKHQPYRRYQHFTHRNTKADWKAAITVDPHAVADIASQLIVGS